MKRYFAVAVILLLAVFEIGWFLPMLFSAKSTVAVLIGVFTTVVSVPFFVWSVKRYVFEAKRIMPIFLFLPSLFIQGCGCSTVPAGNRGVKVFLLGGKKGVDVEELGVGRYWIGFNEDLYLFPVFQQNYTWTQAPDENGEEGDESITFQTSEGLVVNGDIGISFNIDPEKVTTLYQKYRRGIDEITDTFLRNMVRDALNKRASKMQVEQLYGEGKQNFIENVQADVTTQVKDQGIIVDKIYLIGNFRLPEAVVTALNSKIAATQRAQQRENEVQEARAEAEKVKAKAEGERARQQLEAQNITPMLLQKMWLEKWNGQLPQVLTGQNTSAILQLPVKQ